MSSALPDIDLSRPIPIFPLPNCVLLPRAVVPLHLFEPRYREMALETIDDQGLISMALLKPGYEARYYTHHAQIHPTVCVGRMVRHERLDDGRWNVLLQGICRAAVLREDQERSFRRGWLAPIPPVNGLGSDAEDRIRSSLADALKPILGSVSSSGVLLDVIHCPSLCISDMLDLLAFDLISTPAGRLKFLEQPDIRRRAAWIHDMLTQASTAVSVRRPAMSRFQSQN